MSKLSELGTKVGKKILDRNEDGAIDRKDADLLVAQAEKLAQTYEARFPLWSLFVAFAVGVGFSLVALKVF